MFAVLSGRGSVPGVKFALETLGSLKSEIERKEERERERERERDCHKEIYMKEKKRRKKERYVVGERERERVP